MNKFLCAAALLVLSACTSAPSASDQPVGETYTWRCDGGVTFTSRLTSEGNAEVYAGGHTYGVAGVIAASGTRYTNGKVEYWEHGEDVMLNGAEGGPYENCKR